MLKKSAGVEKVSVQFAVKRFEDYEWFRYREWDKTLDTYLVVDPYPSYGGRGLLDESLTDVLTNRAIVALGAGSYYLGHAFAKAGPRINTQMLAAIDAEVEDKLLSEYADIAKDVTKVIFVTGVLGTARYGTVGVERLDKIRQTISGVNPAIEMYALIDPDTERWAAPTNSTVRGYNNGEWQLTALD